MGKEENLKPTLPILDEEMDNEVDPTEQPPSYAEATQSKPAFLDRNFRRGPSRRPSSNKIEASTSFRLQGFPLQYYLPDPKRVKCRCGKHVDTTKRSLYLAAERAECICGYIVRSTGYAWIPSQCNSLLPVRPRKCGCGEALPDDIMRLPTFRCRCEAQFQSDGSVKRFCPHHRKLTSDAQNVQCQCGRYIDTTATWRALHGSKSMTQGEFLSHPRAGWSHYDYTLPEGSGLCVCGLFVSRYGTGGVSDHWKCCSMLSCKPRNIVSDGSTESCTCIYPLSDVV